MQTLFKNDFYSSNDNNKWKEKSYIYWAASTKLENTELNHKQIFVNIKYIILNTPPPLPTLLTYNRKTKITLCVPTDQVSRSPTGLRIHADSHLSLGKPFLLRAEIGDPPSRDITEL